MIDADGSRLAHVAAGTVAPPSGLPIEQRLARITRELRDLIAEWRPEAAAIEDVFVKSDPRAALSLGQGRGALLAVLGELEIPVAAYAPATAKKAVTGNGRAEKTQVAKMVGILLGLAAPPTPADAADALALAITHAVHRNAQDIGTQ